MSIQPSRRTFLKTTAGAVLGSAVLAQSASAQETSTPEENPLKAWFVNTENATAIVDKRGQSEVRIKVGTEGNGGSFAFSPAAVRINPGTKVVWEWTGNGGSHNVVAEDGSFKSELYGSRGTTFEYTPSEMGIIEYACAPHKPMGMKGVLIVGNMTAFLAEEKVTEAKKRSFDGWLDETDNYTEVVDKRGEDTVVIDVGTAANGGMYGFSPAAVRVSRGTQVVWRWAHSGGYNVAALDGSFESDFVSDVGHEFAQTFSSEQVVKYGCEAYTDLGMKGVIVVGNGKFGIQPEEIDVGLVTGVGIGAVTVLSPLGLGLAMHLNQDGKQPTDKREFRPK